jgi:hypothetical protein
MIRHGVSIDSRNQISLLPADVCANNIVAISRIEDPRARAFHLVADEFYTMQAVCEAITRRYGYPFEYMSLPQLIHHMNERCTKEDPLFPLVAFFNHNYRRIDAMRDKRYVSESYRKARALSGRTIEEPSLDETAAAIVTFLQAEHLVPAPPTGAVKAAV